MNPMLRDAAEKLFSIVSVIADRGEEGSSKAEKIRDRLADARLRVDEDGIRKSIREVYSLVNFSDYATDEEFKRAEGVKALLPDDLISEIDADRKEHPGEVVKLFQLKTADQYDGTPMRFVWYPFIPCGEYSIVAAAGGSGKGMFACLIAAYLSSGFQLPEDNPCPDSLRAFPWREPQNVLFISSEDTGNQIRARLGVSHADLKRVFVLDKDESVGLDFSTDAGLQNLENLIVDSRARLVIIDPVQAFIGGETDMNRAAKMRTILSGISQTAGKTKCGILLVAHTSKKAQETDLNGGILGSVETVNAARSVMCIMRDPEDEDPFTSRRLILHTKANNARLARSVRFEIHEEKRTVNGEEVIEAGGRFSEDLYSDVTKELFEESVRRRVTARELLALRKHEETELDLLISALQEEAREMRENKENIRNITYSDFEDRHGGPTIWSGKRCADALGRVAFKVIGDGIALKAGISVNAGGKKREKGLKITLTR